MAGHDAELDQFRAGVSCAALLERLPPPWFLDKQESTRRALKYRRGQGEVLIVNHDGRWHPWRADDLPGLRRVLQRGEATALDSAADA